MYDRNQLLDTHRRFINKGWYDSTISLDKLEQWLDNFDTPNSNDNFDTKICAKFLLDAIVFYQTNHMVAIIDSIINQKKSMLNEIKEKELGRRLSETELQTEWEQYTSECYIVAAAKPEDAGGSAHNAVRHWRNHTGIEGGTVASLRNAVVQQNKKHIFFVDDFIGTGSKMEKFLTNELFPDKNTYGFLTIKEFMEDHHDGIDYNIAVFALYEKGYNHLRDLFKDTNFYYGEFYDKSYDLCSEESPLYDLYEEEKAHIVAYLRTKQAELDSDNKYALNLPIAFTHGCPNNTLALYYKQIPNWADLFQETNPHHN